MEPMKPMKPMKPMAPMAPIKPPEAWWPRDLGDPSSSGSQNETRYAYFDNSRRLVVQAGGETKTYDTGDKRISGFGQQQGNAKSMTFQSDSGPVALDDLKLAQ